MDLSTQQSLQPAQSAARMYHNPAWLIPQLASNHAAANGLLGIYQGILSVSRDASVRALAQEHHEAQISQVRSMGALLAENEQLFSVPVRRRLGNLFGALLAISPSEDLYSLISSLQRQMSSGYRDQVDTLVADGEMIVSGLLRDTLRDTEVRAEEAAARAGSRRSGPIAYLLSLIVTGRSSG